MTHESQTGATALEKSPGRVPHPNNPRMWLTQLISFASVGLVGTAAQYLLLILAVEIADINAVVASVAGFVVGAVINYVLNYRFTFRSNKRHSETMAKFFAIALSGMALNGGIMQVTVHHFGFHYLASQVFATGVVFFWNFLANRLWTFKG